jgi:hypothetical protein
MDQDLLSRDGAAFAIAQTGLYQIAADKEETVDPAFIPIGRPL